jgi:hypothetical protein
MEVHDPPGHIRYCPSAAERIEFFPFSPATGLQKLNFIVADRPFAITPFPVVVLSRQICV